MNSEFWQDKIKAFLHDPPDKALILGYIAHEKRRDAILQTLKLTYDKRLDSADHIASAMQRIDLPLEMQSYHIYFKDPVKPVFKHTLSGEIENLDELKDYIARYGDGKAVDVYSFNLEIIKKHLKKQSEIDWKKTYFHLWKYLPEEYPLGYFLPADTRIPDHSIWDHLDVTAAISSCLGSLGLLSLKMPAVQEFISQSRKLSDLWASSHIFSQLIFEGIKVIIEECGPDAVIYPHLRGSSLFDIYIGVEPTRLRDQLQVANIPNTFLSFIPSKRADEIARKCEDKIKGRWKEIAGHLKKIIKEKTDIEIDESLWEEQINHAISVSAAWQEVFNFDIFQDERDELPKDLANRQEEWLNFVEEADRRSNYGHFYYLTYELLGTVLAQESRLWDAWEEKPITGKKCLMCGRRNAVIERDSEGKYRYWQTNWKNLEKIEDGLRFILKERERLCAVCLTKRIYPQVFKEEFKVMPPEFESVVDIAARDFIKEARGDEDIKEMIKEDVELIYKHEWESKEKKNVVKQYERIKEKLEKLWKTYGEPNKYYAILMMDGDKIGEVLSGEKLPSFGEFLHPAFKNKIREWERGEELMTTKRILTPSHHIAISRAMKDFSLYKVPEIVKYNGFLVYAGGDDVLALFPADKVLDVAYEIQETFKEDFYEIEDNGKRRKVMGLGNKASMSAGIVFAHYKWPLYDAIEKVREAEKKAKGKYGRKALCITFIKRSGEISIAGGKWDFVTDLLDIAKVIANRKISHRFVYDFMDVGEILEGDMLKAEVKRLLKRRKEEASDEEIKEIQEKLLCLIEKYRAQDLSIKELGNALKILYDAYRGEEI